MQDVEGDFSRRLRETREAAGLSQARLAEALERRAGIALDPTAITRIERGQRGISLGEAHGLAATLGVSLAYLCRIPEEDRIDDLRASIEAARREEAAAAESVRAESERMTQARLRVSNLERRLASEQEAIGRAILRVPQMSVQTRDLDDLKTAAAAFDNGRIVDLDLRSMSEIDRRRAGDFVAGLVRGGLRGSVEQSAPGILRINPRGYGRVDTPDSAVFGVAMAADRRELVQEGQGEVATQAPQVPGSLNSGQLAAAEGLAAELRRVPDEEHADLLATVLMGVPGDRTARESVRKAVMDYVEDGGYDFLAVTSMLVARVAPEALPALARLREPAADGETARNRIASVRAAIDASFRSDEKGT